MLKSYVIKIESPKIILCTAFPFKKINPISSRAGHNTYACKIEKYKKIPPLYIY